MSQTPTLAEVLTSALDARLDRVHTSLPAKVLSYNATKQMVDVSPLIKTRFFDETGAPIVEALPVVTNVPVIFPGSGSFGLTFPVTTGDIVLLIFAESSLDKWKSQGGTVDPLDHRKHDLSDAVAIVGLRPLPNVLHNVPDSNFITLGSDSGLSDFVALAAKTNARLANLEAAMNSHAHASFGAPATPIPGVLPVETITPGTGIVGSVGSAVVKIKG